MVPIIISYDCADHDPIDAWEPPDPLDVDFWMNFTIGYDKRGGDNFQLHVVTPNNTKGPDAAKHTIVLDRYKWECVLVEVNNILDACHGTDWDDVSAKLAKYMSWEFEDYKPYKGAR